VVLRHNGRELWRGEIGTTLSSHSVPLRIEQGSATVEFSSDTPPQIEGPNPDARNLSFALYDVRLTLAKP
ncbi:MAG: hypothetical protein NTV51_27940, partial [Verrucomicrobia bacterium]|nr:hypothetical protein [Verrucomicrobiota bacterium]